MYSVPQQPAVLQGEELQTLESPVHITENNHSMMESHGSYTTVAQLPVVVAETHQAPGIFPRSTSMPLPNSSAGETQLSYSASNIMANQQLLGGLNSNSEVKSATVTKIEHLKNWSISTYKCTRQLISEKLGKSSRTVDTELESQIELLRDVQRKYLNILRLSRALSSHFQHVVVTQVNAFINIHSIYELISKV